MHLNSDFKRKLFMGRLPFSIIFCIDPNRFSHFSHLASHLFPFTVQHFFPGRDHISGRVEKSERNCSQCMEAGSTARQRVCIRTQIFFLQNIIDIRGLCGSVLCGSVFFSNMLTSFFASKCFVELLDTHIHTEAFLPKYFSKASTLCRSPGMGR